MLKKFVKDLAIYSPAKFLPALTAFITTPILTRLFPPAEYGQWAIATSLSAFLAALAAGGYGSAAIRFFPVYKTRSALGVFFATLAVSVGVVITFIAGVSSLVLLLLKEHLPSALHPLLPIVILIFFAQSIYSVFIAVMRVQGRSGAFTSLELIVNYFGLGVGIIFVVFFGFRVNGLLWGNFLALVLALPILIFLVTKGINISPRFFHLTDAVQFWQYAWPLALGNVAMWGLRVSDLFIIRLFRPERDVGLYSVSYSLSSKSIELLVALFLLSVSPLVYRTWEGEGREATEKTITIVTRVYLIICLPAAVGLSILAFPFVAMLTSPDYHEGFKIVGFVVFSSFVWGLSNIAMLGIAIKKKTGRLGANIIIAATVHVILQLILVPRFGYIASAISTLIGYTVLLLQNALASKPYLTWRFPFSTLRNVIAASIAMGLSAWGIYKLAGVVKKVSLIYLFLSIIVAALIYFLCLWFLGEIKKVEKQTILRLFNRVLGREA